MVTPTLVQTGTKMIIIFDFVATYDDMFPVLSTIVLSISTADSIHVISWTWARVNSCTNMWPRLVAWMNTSEHEQEFSSYHRDTAPDSEVHGANMGTICCRQDPGGPHVGPTNFALWGLSVCWFQGPYMIHVLYLVQMVGTPLMNKVYIRYNRLRINMCAIPIDKNTIITLQN